MNAEIFGNIGVACGSCTSRYHQGQQVAEDQAGAKKIATLGYGISSNSKQCADSGADSIKKYAANIGNPEVAYVNDNLQFGLANGVGPEVTAMKDAGADFIFLCIDLNGAKTVAQELQRQGIRDKVKMYHPNTYDQAFVAAAGDLFNGDYIGVGFRPFEADPGSSGLKDYREWMAKNGKAETEIAMDGWINADLAYQGLVAAGPSFDRAKVIAGTNTLTAFTADGLIPATRTGAVSHEAPTAGG